MVSPLGGCSGPERTHFYHSVFTFGGCGGLEKTDFNRFLLWECVVVLKELSTVSHLGGCGGPERTHF